MALLEKHLYVKKSNIPEAGKGLFTKVEIPKGEKIVEYKGKRTVWKAVKDDDGKNGYIFYITRNCVIDALANKEALGRYANDASGLTKVKEIKNNAEYVIEGKRCFIVSKRKIAPKSEIFVSYGAEYWKTVRDNIALDKKTKKEELKRGGKKGSSGKGKKK